MKKLTTFFLTLLLFTLGASAQTDFSWALSAGTWYGNTGTYGNAVEHYQDGSSGGACTAGKILYEIVSELPAGEYTLTFYAVANMAWNSYATGSDIAQVYVTANGETQTEDVNVYDQTACTPSDYPHTFTVTVGEDGLLEYGLQNIATGGNWYVCQGVSLIFSGEAETKELEPGDVVEEEPGDESNLTHYSLTYTGSGSNGGLDYNTWSGESGMTTPYHQVWVYMGDNKNVTLSDMTINHYEISLLPAGTYTVTVDARVLSEAGNGINEGSAFFCANEASVDIVAEATTDEDFTYGTATEHEANGTYTLTATVGDDGILSIYFTIKDATYNWISWKNLNVTFVEAAVVEPEPTAIEGDYLVMNSGLYFGTGLTDGRQVTLLKNPMYVGFELQDDGTYLLDSYEYNYGTGDGQHYFGRSSSVAGVCSFASTVYTWAVEKQADGTYTIYCTYSGREGYLTAHGELEVATLESEPSEGSYWTLITKDEFIASIPDAEKPVDVSALIDFPDFKTYCNEGYYNDETLPWPWEVLDGDIYVGVDSNIGYDWASFGNAAESYHDIFDICQDIVLPYAGTYTLTAQGFYRADAEEYELPYLYVTANGETQEVAFPALEGESIASLSAAADAFYEGLYPIGTIVVEAPADNTAMRIGFKCDGDEQWTTFSQLVLLYYADEPVPEPEPTPEPTEPEDIHECVAEFDHWSISGNTGGAFQLNTWSTEADASGMVTPFIEYWIGSGSVLSNATISHTQLTDLEEGYYSVSIFARAFNENSTTPVSEGITFTANEGSIDLTTGTTATYNGVSEEVYGTYTLLVYVTGGTLDIGFTVEGLTACDWVAFKNLSVTYFGVEMPTLAAVTGVMNADVEAAMNTAVDAYNDNKNAETYYAAMEAIEAAEASVEYYAPIVAAVDALDDAGATVWATSQYAAMLTARTLTNQNVGTDLAAAQKAQITNGSDMSYVAQYDGSWTADQGNGPATCPSLSTATETYNTADYAEGKVLYKTITGLTPGTYTVSFYVQANAANVTGLTSGDGIAQAYANDGTPVDVTVGTLTNLGNEWPEGSLVTITCEVDSYGVLEFGLQNVAAGGNWYVAEASALTLDKVNTDIPTSIENVEEAGTELAKEGIYTLSGVRLNKITKSGIYIVDGKKMIVK